jgi:hypothetical protein
MATQFSTVQHDSHRQYVAEPITSSNVSLIVRRTYISDHNALESRNCLRKYARANIAYRVYRIESHGRHVTVYRGPLR